MKYVDQCLTLMLKKWTWDSADISMLVIFITWLWTNGAIWGLVLLLFSFPKSPSSIFIDVNMNFYRLRNIFLWCSSYTVQVGKESLGKSWSNFSSRGHCCNRAEAPLHDYNFSNLLWVLPIWTCYRSFDRTITKFFHCLFFSRNSLWHLVGKKSGISECVHFEHVHAHTQSLASLINTQATCRD